MISLIEIFIIIFIIVICISSLKKISKQIKQKINNINLLMNKIYEQIGIHYPSIYYELKKIDSFVLSEKFKSCSIKIKKTILKHLEDIENILIKIHEQKNKNNAIEFSFPYMMILTYHQIIKILKDKYGEVPGNYFLDQQCTKINKDIKKSSEGLEIHHIKEYEIKGLSNPELASKAPFDYQKQNNLVYCNLIEHFLLHCKIWDHSINPLQLDVGKKGASILLKKLEKNYFSHYWENQYYKRKAVQKIFYKRNDFFKCRSFYITLKTLKNLQN